MSGLEGRLALVTGASRGIGEHCARALAENGARVALAARSKDDLDRVAENLPNDPVVLTVDLEEKGAGASLASEAVAALGGVDILVNNAGSSPGGIIEHLSEDDWAQSLQLKFMGYVRCLRHVLPIMVEQGGGRVVNLIGNDGVKPSYWEIAPGAANAAGQNLTMSLAGQYGKDNISFVAVNPGPVRTERWTGLVNAMARDMGLSFEEADKLAPSSIPLGRIA